ncbi:MAG TPA: glycerol-3-phosphate acyltransferase, partial [Phnomibacter sp.]|nr:glycerol-3-phosphate acyltransferase [Phnomibacter sp.]
TNTVRVLGKGWGSFVMAVEILKGVLASFLYLLLPYYLTDEFHRTNLMVGLGMAAVLGHIFPIWAGFKGGKGVATVFGMVLAIQPLVALAVVGIFLLVLFLTRFVSLSSILASLALPILILVIFNEPEPLYRIFAIAVALLVILTHQKNIQRLLNGNESKARILKYRDRKRERRF